MIYVHLYTVLSCIAIMIIIILLLYQRLLADMEKRDAQLRDQEEELKQKDVEISRLGRELRQCQTQLEQVCLNLASSWGGGTLTIAFAIVLLILSVHVHEGLHRTCSVCPSLCVTTKSAAYIIYALTTRYRSLIYRFLHDFFRLFCCVALLKKLRSGVMTVFS